MKVPRCHWASHQVMFSTSTVCSRPIYHLAMVSNVKVSVTLAACKNCKLENTFVQIQLLWGDAYYPSKHAGSGPVPASYGMFTGPQAVLFGRWEVGGVGLRGSIAYRLTNSSKTWIDQCVWYTPFSMNFHFPNLPLPNNNACDYYLPTRDNYWHQVSVGIYFGIIHIPCVLISKSLHHTQSQRAVSLVITHDHCF